MSERPDYNRIDLAIGCRIAELRAAKGLPAEKVAQELNLTVDQYVAREEGRERFYASQLFQLADLLNVGMAEFYRSLRY